MGATTILGGRWNFTGPVGVPPVEEPRCLAVLASSILPSRERQLRSVSPRLDARLLVAAEHDIGLAQRPALPPLGVQIEHPRRLRAEVGIAREDPRLVLPRLDRVAVQDPAGRAATHRPTDAILHAAGQIREGLPAQGFAGLGHTLASEGFDPSAVQRGKKRPSGRVRCGRGCRTHRWPSVGLGGRTIRPSGRPRRGRSRGVREPPGRGGTAGHRGRRWCGGRRRRGPLARNRPGRYNASASDLASAATCIW